MADRSIELDTPVQYLRGVGPYRARAFEALGVRTVHDLIHYAPFRYEVFPRSIPIGDLRLDETATVVGTLVSVRRRGVGRKAGAIAEVADGTGRCTVRWFNAPHVAEKLQRGAVIRLTGKVDEDRDTAQFVNPRFDTIDPDADPFTDDVERFEPVYSASAELSSSVIARTVSSVLPQAVEQIPETLPDALRSARSLPPRRTSLTRIHHPVHIDDAEIARNRLAYDELLLLQLAVGVARNARSRAGAASQVPVSDRVDQRIRKRFPFPLTPGQNAAVAEIVADLDSQRPMNRLLQGDVGSGKTAVALYAALAVIAAGGQVAFVAPTEILAEQHFRKVERYLAGSRVRTALIVGGMPKTRRAELIDATADGRINLLIGTHALFEKDVVFKDLVLLIVDEQHKFGVAQRASAKRKGVAPHCLILSATPIPRTLAITLFGELDSSTIRDAPPGRKPVETRVVSERHLDDVWREVRERVASGDQAYLVYPLVEESEALPLQAATREFERLRSGPLSGVKLGLVHGRMAREERDAVMNAFRSGDIQALVSTTVIEVGVDVPQATLMVVQHANRFGLSQLHQLRGRIGRGERQSLCILVHPGRDGAMNERLRILQRSADGFFIAQEDLRLRGPGEWLGKRQHGLPQFRFADLARDGELLEAARADAGSILRADPRLRESRHTALRTELLRRYRDTISFMNVG